MEEELITYIVHMITLQDNPTNRGNGTSSSPSSLEIFKGLNVTMMFQQFDAEVMIMYDGGIK